MDGNTPLSQIKTVQQLLMVLVAEGWQKSPWDHPSVFPGCSSDRLPCWELSDGLTNIRTGVSTIYLHPGLGEDDGNLFASADHRDGQILEWCLQEYYSDDFIILEPESLCINELKDRLVIWGSTWAREAS